MKCTKSKINNMSIPKMLRGPVFFIFTEKIDHFLEMDRGLIDDFNVFQKNIKLYQNKIDDKLRFNRDIYKMRKDVKAIYLQESIIRNKAFDIGNYLNENMFPRLTKKKIPIITCGLIGKQPAWLTNNFNGTNEVSFFLRQKMIENNIFLNEKMSTAIAS